MLTDMTVSLIDVVLILLAYILIGEVWNIGYHKGYQDGAASRQPRKRIGFKTNNVNDHDTTAIH